MFVQYSDTLESTLQAAEDDWLFDDKDKKDAPQADDNDSEDDFTFRMFPNFILADFCWFVSLFWMFSVSLQTMETCQHLRFAPDELEKLQCPPKPVNKELKAKLWTNL